MNMTSRDRAKTNAALVMLKDAGHDPAEVTGLAQKIINMGTPPRLAYERAFNAFVERVPSFRAPLQRLGQVIEASDNRTVSGYNVALERYIATGDPASVQAVLPTLQQDMATMATLTGDAAFADGLSDTLTPAPAEASAPSPTECRPGWGAHGYSPGNSDGSAPATTSPGESIGGPSSAPRPGWTGEGYRPASTAE
jgi:hypothetical protein